MPTADLAIRNVRILDGTGAPAVDGDVTVGGGRILSVGGEAGPARAVVDGGGRTLAPGFVDTHTHDDGALIAHPDLRFKLSQGCTSLVIGNCGYSAVPARLGAPPAGGLLGTVAATWTDLESFRTTVAGRRPACNAIALAGHNTIRLDTLGPERRPATPAEMATMRAHVARAMEQGACGFSTGLIYVPGRWTDTDEIVELARAASDGGGIYATHMRNEGDRLLDAVAEAISIGRDAGIAVQISHHKAAGARNWGRVGASLALVDAANEAGGDVSLDVYPYTAGSGRMVEYFDLDRIEVDLAGVIRLASCPAFPEYEGRMLADIASDGGVGLEDVVRTILTAPLGDRTICIHFIIDEADIETNLRHPRMMIGSDGIPDLRGKPHPRLFGTFPRVLGEYVRRRGVLSLPEAVRRMTSLSCRRFGLAERGEIREGWHADLVLFDPDTVTDLATYDDPALESAGVDLVVVNGTVAFDHGVHTGAGTGRLLRFNDPNS